MKQILSLFLFILPIFVWPQNNFFILKAGVYDGQTGLPLPGATVTVKEVGKKFVSDPSGVVKMALVPGSYTLITTSDDYASGIKTIEATADSTLTIELQPFDKSVVMEEITVVENLPLKSNRIETGLESLTSATISSIPAIAGEKDLIKSLATKPGMHIASEGVSKLIVRGGNPDQNQFLLNGLPMYQTHHFFSMLSAVNPMLIDKVDVYKSGFPVQFGGRVSSVIDMGIKAPDMDSVHGEGDIGILSAKAIVSIPIVKNKLTVLVSARRTYLDLMARLFVKELDDLSFNYTDLSFLMNWKLSDKSSFLFFNNYSRDHFIFDPGYDNKGEDLTDHGKSWDNLLSGVEWRYTAEQFSNELKAGYSGNLMKIGAAYSMDSLNYFNSTFRSGLQHYLLIDRFGADLSERMKLDAGLQVEAVQLAPASLDFSTPDTSWTQQRIAESWFESGAVWASVNYAATKLKAQAGLRGTVYLYEGRAYSVIEPRINLFYSLTESSSLKASFSSISQPLHLLSNTGLGLPVDLWIGPSEKRKPILSDHWAAGFYKNIPIGGKRYEISVEGYYKTTQNIISYRDGFSSAIFTSVNYIEKPSYLEDVIAYGQGKSYGIEVLVEKLEGPLTGWISYTLSKSLHSFDAFENGNWFNSPYDRPHNLAVVGSYQLGKGWDFNFSFSLLSGQPFTLPVAVYPMYSFEILTSKTTPSYFNTVFVNSERNGFRLKTFHKLDIGIRKQLKSKRNYSHWLELSAYNVYNRANSTYGYFSFSKENKRLDVVSVSLFPIIPGISYGFRF